MIDQVIKSLTAAIAIVSLSAAAQAHPGHFVEAAGHSHWLELAAVAGVALIATVWIVRASARR